MKRRAVVTGIGCLAPNGSGREAFASALQAGRSGIRKLTLFDPAGLPVSIAGELDAFDPAAHLPAKEVARLSRAVPMAIAASEEAFKDAGVDWSTQSLESAREWNVLLGTGGGAVEFAERMYQLYFTGQQRRASAHTISTGTMGTMSSELSMRFGLRGSSHVITTGCASSTDALGYAFRAIKHGEASAFLVGGVDATIVRGILEGFILMRVVSTRRDAEPTAASRPFSADRDGFVLGEGSWMFVLEDSERAAARGARVHGEILGYGATCDAHHRIRLDESGDEPARAMTLALGEAGLAPAGVDYIAYHGTGTELNDRVETRAVKKAFGETANRLAGSSIKSMIGHPQGACGAAGVAATLLAMRGGFLPPTINLERADPECGLDYVANASRPRKFETALCNCIAFGSKNSALVLRAAT
ncbi:MAG: beta-ketoacyl-[acyl-carrier-protein] synthase family protein [Thermoanaerobaculia bacterium]